MGLARLVVVEGPDVGVEFQLTLRGGGIGRGEDNVVQLSDLSVSRSHCTIELRDGRLTLIDHGSRNKTIVNGQPIDTHVLTEGDEISIGKTRMAFLPAEGGLAVYQGRPSRVTIEVGSSEMLAPHERGAAPVRPPAGDVSPPSPDDRARRYLAAIAGLGNTLRETPDRAAMSRAACEATLAAMAADRAFLIQRDAGGRMAPSAAAVSPRDPDGAQLAVARNVIDRVLADGTAIAIEVPSASGQTRHAMAAPLASASGIFGLLYTDRRAGLPPDRTDLYALGSLAHVISAAFAGAESREVLERENQALEDRLGERELIGSSQRTRSVLDFVTKVAPSDATVLLTGESGSGKEMVARAIHRSSRRRRQPFIAVNCAALTETLIESELFGHEKGAFTGATERKIGRFEAADKGTLFLDEVGELPQSCQTKFLRVLEEQCFERVGGTRSIAVDVRVVAATNRILPDMVARGQFREDLFYRLSVIHTEIPPLRDRAQDIPELAEYFLSRLRAGAARRVIGFSQDAMRALCSHGWPGNVRELKNAIERALVLGDGEYIRLEDLPPQLSAAGNRAPPTAPFASYRPSSATAPPAAPAAVTPVPGGGDIQRLTPPMGSLPIVPRSLKELEREGIVAALRATGGNKAQAAAILEIDRSTLYKKIKDYDIDA